MASSGEHVNQMLCGRLSFTPPLSPLHLSLPCSVSRKTDLYVLHHGVSHPLASCWVWLIGKKTRDGGREESDV